MTLLTGAGVDTANDRLLIYDASATLDKAITPAEFLTLVPAGGDMVLASVQTVTGAKTFGSAGAVGKLILAGSTSGSSILNAAAVAGSTTITLPGVTSTLATLGANTFTGAQTVGGSLYGTNGLIIQSDAGGAGNVITIQGFQSEYNTTVANSLAGASFTFRNSGKFTGSAAAQVGVALTHTYQQSGTAGGTDLLINRTETSLGSGAQFFTDFQVAGVSKFSVTNVGLVNAGGGVTIGSGAALKLGNAATTGLGAGVVAALTNATIVITDQAGQAYRIPCLI
jgi:hypothetical protein